MPSVIDDVDVAVVGGGPAGSAAAIICAQRGLRVALYETRCFPRDRPGESLHPGVQPLLVQLGVESAVIAAGFLRHTGIRFACDEDTPKYEAFGADANGVWRGFQAIRATFDHILLTHAADAGVCVAQSQRAVKPIVRAGRVVGIESASRSTNARYVIDAAGGSHWSQRHLGVRIARISPRLIARYGYSFGACPELDGAPTFRADRAGWSWMAKVDDRLYHWTRLDYAGGVNAKVSPPPPLGLLVPTAPFRGADVTWRVATTPAGPGYFLAGDAAIVLDPASSHGVLRAIMMGIMAAHAATLVCTSQLAGAVAEAEYQRWAMSWFLEDVATLANRYARLDYVPTWIRDGTVARRLRRVASDAGEPTTDSPASNGRGGPCHTPVFAQ